MTKAEQKKERAKRLDVMAKVHGVWVRAYMKDGPMPHCDCSRCMLPSPPAVFS